MINRFTKLCATAALAVMALGVSAANWHGMEVMLKDGSDVHILLTDSFVASFTDTDFHLENEKTKFDVPRVQISSMSFTEDAPPTRAPTQSPTTVPRMSIPERRRSTT